MTSILLVYEDFRKSSSDWNEVFKTNFNRQLIYLSTKSWISDFNISSRYRTSFNMGFKTFLWQQQWQEMARPSLFSSWGQKLSEETLECLCISRHGSLALPCFLSFCTLPTEYLEQWRQRLSEQQFPPERLDTNVLRTLEFICNRIGKTFW